ncbi:hypothetical protein JY651_33280 [Pyxidicoccus parkwayensis]|uniref:Uncharacterized protein n=1 Tax=Pyxidicoccus parkwayensis TaxID=2813578 RepID=A0ABX7NMX2_9BACT|nr:DUF4190 domain-containing protein [Pyxidicoccus parkwaysis]QSQ20120.1 hypothetical protein JY651_33280 [Pyxidicoccus parkwaysis]
MSAQPLSQPSVVGASRCYIHPGRPALGTCARCGIFYCDRDHRVVEGKAYCEDCSIRPDVDYLEAFRLKYWGRRDFWAWFVGFGAALHIFSGFSIFTTGAVEAMPLGVFGFLAGVVEVFFWLGVPWARRALIGVPIVFMAVGVMYGGLVAVAFGIFGLLVSIAINMDTRNKLFFKREVSREALQKSWDLYMNNAMARAGLMLGVASLIPGVGIVALACSISGLLQVDPKATPPIGRKGQAIAGIVLGALGTLYWGNFVLSEIFK